MSPHTELFINGAHAPARGESDLPVTDSFTEQTFASYRTASTADVDAAVAGARRAFATWSTTPVQKRIAAVRRIAAGLRDQAEALTIAISREVGMPRKLAARIQVGAPVAAWDMYADLAGEMEWESRIGHSLVQQVPVGVVACITPWNYPLHQITGKVAPALVAGCTVVLKPSELAPSSAFMLARAVEQAGLPAGVFNLVHGTGHEVGEALVRHPEVDMVSFTGSTRAGRHIAALAAGEIKRVALELGGKSAALILPGADMGAAVKATLASCMLNSGQTCSATTRLLVPRDLCEAAAAIARDLLAGYRMGDPADGATRLAPLISKAQQQKVQAMVDGALAAGAHRVGDDVALPAQGFFVPPTVLTGVTPEMAIARDEVFGLGRENGRLGIKEFLEPVSMDMEELEVLPPEDIRAEEWMRPFDMNRRADYQTRYSYFPAAPKPIVSAINGAAAGLGLVMALYSDFRIASDKGVFATAFAKRGLIAEHGIAWMLPRVVGHAHATDLLLTSRKVDAQEALGMGLVHRVVTADELLPATRALALTTSSEVSPRSVRVMKRQLWDAPYQSLGDSIALANAEMVESLRSEDFTEGVKHFVERRPAQFTGR